MTGLDLIRRLDDWSSRAEDAALAILHAAIATLLGEDGPLKDFVVAALTLSPYLRDTARVDPRLLARALDEPILSTIEAAIARAGGVIAQAATDLGMSRQALYRRMERFGIKAT